MVATATASGTRAALRLRIDGRVHRESDVHLVGRQPHRPFEARRPTSGEQLLRIGAAGCAARETACASNSLGRRDRSEALFCFPTVFVVRRSAFCRL